MRFLPVSTPGQNFTIPAVLLAPLSLWDMYVAGVRPFDLAVAGLIALYAIVRSGRPLKAREATGFTLFALLVVLVSLHGILRDTEALKTVLGLVLGVSVGLIIAASYWTPRHVRLGLAVLVLVHAAFLMIQLMIYYSTRVIVNYHGWLGSEPRLVSLFFRPAGLFQEPATYCLNMFAMLTLYRFADGRYGAVDLVGLTTMALSLSLWGIIACVLYLALFRPVWAVLAAFGALFGGTIALASLGPNSIVTQALVKRLQNLGQDSSAQSRYGGLLPDDLWKTEVWFGRGVAKEYVDTGSSSLSFLTHTGGVIALVALVVFWIAITPPDRRFRSLAVLAFMLTAASQWTALWWWTWLALAAALPRSDDRGDVTDIRLPISTRPVAPMAA